MIKLTDEIYVMSDGAQYIVGKPITAISKGVELFARDCADGWDCWGNEVKDDESCID
jgi:N6-adenosine-specific RNA methylase IME4